MKSLPSWELLPNIKLYNDQLIDYVKQILMNDENDNINITRAMIVNYIKLGLLVPPEKKKFSKENIAALIIISFFKVSFSLAEIKSLFETYDYHVETLYNQFQSILANINEEIHTNDKLSMMILSVLCKNQAKKLSQQHITQN